MVVAVYNKSTGGGPDGVVRAMRIARAKLGQWGYLYHLGGNQVLEQVQLTGKGWVRNQKHLSEGLSGMGKDLEFARLFKMIEPRLYELDGPGGVKPPRDMLDQPGKESDEQGDIAFDDRARPVYPGPTRVPKPDSSISGIPPKKS